MKICYIHQYFNFASDSGSQRSRWIAEELALRGHQVTVLALDRSAKTSSNTWLELQSEPIRVLVLSEPYDNSFGARERIRSFLRFSWRATLKSLSLRPEVIFATSTPLTVAIPGLIHKLVRRSRFVFEVRDQWPRLPIALGELTNPVAISVSQLLERVSYRFADEVIALSPGMVEGVCDVGCSRDKVHLIPNMAEIRSAGGNDRASDWLKDKAELQGRRFLAYCGTIGKIYDLEYLVNLAVSLHEISSDLIIVIVGDGAQRDFIAARAEESGVLDRNLFIYERVASSVAIDILALSVAALSVTADTPELEDNCANKVFSALGVGKPVFLNYGGWQQQLLESNGGGRRLPRNTTHAARELVMCLEDAEWLAVAEESALALASQEFNHVSLASKAADVITRSTR